MNWEIIHIDETDSTNRWLRDRQQPKESDGNIGGEARCAVAVVADYQTLLEEIWVEELRKKFDVKINWKELNTLR